MLWFFKNKLKVTIKPSQNNNQFFHNNSNQFRTYNWIWIENQKFWFGLADSDWFRIAGLVICFSGFLCVDFGNNSLLGVYMINFGVLWSMMRMIYLPSESHNWRRVEDKVWWSMVRNLWCFFWCSNIFICVNKI